MWGGILIAIWANIVLNSYIFGIFVLSIVCFISKNCAIQFKHFALTTKTLSFLHFTLLKIEVDKLS